MKEKKCGIVTFHSAHNYGSVLQAYALTSTIKKMGISAEIVDFRHPHTTEMYEWKIWSSYKDWKWNLKELLIRGIFKFGKKRESVFNDFIENVLPLSNRIVSEKEIADKYDFLICGSDQIWNPSASGENHPIYFLDFETNAKKIAYAVSSGSKDFGINEKERYKKILTGFHSIGVREDPMKNYLETTFRVHANVNPDPTFLIEKDCWEAMEKPYPNLPEKFLLLYTIQKPEKVASFAKAVAKKMNLPVVQICNERGFKALKHSGVDFCLMDVAPQQFLWLFNHAFFVVTNTFHGNMFSIIFRKNFIHYSINPHDSRISTLHNAIGLGENRFINSENNLDRLDIKINYEKLEEKINSYRKEGLDFLKTNLI